MAVSKEKKKRIWERCNRCCSYCHRPISFDMVTIDHIIPKSVFKDMRDADEESNLCVACGICNAAKAAMSVKEFKKWVNSRNNELLKLEADRRSAIAKAEELSKRIESRRFSYVQHLRMSFTAHFDGNYVNSHKID